MLPDNAYTVIQSFMRNDLHLEKTELLVYAVIHGFSQGGDGCFVGTNEFLSEWTGAKERAVRTAISSLAEKGLIEKGQAVIDGIAVRTLKSTPAEIAAPGRNCRDPRQKMPRPPAKNAAPIYVKKIDEKDIQKDITPITPLSKSVEEIIGYLNAKTGRKYRAKGKNAQLVSARLSEGYSVDDFKRVVDVKVAEWGLDSHWSKYLRPETLFCKAHFDGYLNQPMRGEVSANAPSEWDDVSIEVSSC